MQRRSFKPILSFPDQPSEDAARQEAESLPTGEKQDSAGDKATQADIDALIDKWVRSPGLQPPK
jgi:hypothetical protein